MPKTKVLACGTFDLLHPGHVFFLRQAKLLGDHLTVLVALSSNVQKIKNHPPAEDTDTRTKNIANLDFVDTIIIGNEKDFLQKLQEVNPDILALGYDQSLPFPESQLKSNFPSLKTKRLPAYKPHLHKTTLKRNLNANPQNNSH